MSLFEDIAVLDLQFRIVLVAAMLTFLGVGFPVVFALESELGFVVGGVVAVVVGYLTARRLA
ncbi:hypothetical protein NGM10_15820 (plasmid) [Halorussus salilacus]|uniref:hypothetical protein n=1 Tax=Halorussus salilacus TaxID=2953750 RepID=UPI0020A17658|nr:hypothetical protein [Halorussus salilacus]USZ69871.1 hypothetical protein NGM10_15820 [Halorussus salilacus]